MYYICWSTFELYFTGTVADCTPELCVTVWNYSWQIYHSDVPECPHLVGVSRKFNMTKCNYFLQPVYVSHCYLSKPHTLCCYSGVYFLLTLFSCHFFGSFFILVIHCVAFLVTTFFFCFLLLLWFLLCISSPILILISTIGWRMTNSET